MSPIERQMEEEESADEFFRRMPLLSNFDVRFDQRSLFFLGLLKCGKCVFFIRCGFLLLQIEDLF